MSSTYARPALGAPDRPIGVSVAVALMVIAALGDIVLAAGAWYVGVHPLLLARTHLTGASTHAVALGASGLALLLLVLATALARGSGFARGLTTIALVVRGGCAAMSVIAVGAVSIGVDLLAVAVSALVLTLLWSRTANAFYLT